jgi:hypothetical protein
MRTGRIKITAKRAGEITAKLTNDPLSKARFSAH